MARPEIQHALQTARDAPRRAADSTWVDRLARYGLVAKGVSYGLVGLLAAALAIAGSGSGKATSREGALATLADESYGKALLVAMALGFASYGLWRVVQALFDRDDDGSGIKGIAKRVGYLGRAVVYGALTYVTLHLLTGADEGGTQTQDARRTTAEILDWPAGRWLVGAVGAAFVGAACFNAYRAFTQKFEEKWNTGKMSTVKRRWATRLSSLGLLARAVVFALIGVFVAKAAWEYDPQEAIGIDGALRKLLQAAYGPVLLGIVAVGLLCYALFCFVEARYRRV